MVYFRHVRSTPTGLRAQVRVCLGVWLSVTRMVSEHAKRSEIRRNDVSKIRNEFILEHLAKRGISTLFPALFDEEKVSGLNPYSRLRLGELIIPTGST